MGVDVDQDYGIGIERMLGLTRKNEEHLNIMRGERIYQYEVDMTGTIDAGSRSWPAASACCVPASRCLIYLRM